MNQPLSLETITAWNQLIQNHLSGSGRDFVESINRFLESDMDRVGMMKQALRGKNRVTALYLLPRLQVPEAMLLFDELIFLASFSHGSLQIVRDAILALPRSFVLEHIENTAEPLLANGTYDEYRRFLELYSLMDTDLAKGLALRAAKNNDQDIQEAGEDFLSRLKRLQNHCVQ